MDGAQLDTNKYGTHTNTNFSVIVTMGSVSVCGHVVMGEV